MELPSSFTDYTRALLGVEEYEKLAAALEGEQPVSIRLNEDKLPESSFSLFRSSLEHVPWSAAGYYLDKRRHSLSTRCFMQAATMCRRLRPCLWSRL